MPFLVQSYLQIFQTIKIPIIILDTCFQRQEVYHDKKISLDLRRQVQLVSGIRVSKVVGVSTLTLCYTYLCPYSKKRSVVFLLIRSLVERQTWKTFDESGIPTTLHFRQKVLSFWAKSHQNSDNTSQCFMNVSYSWCFMGHRYCNDTKQFIF